MILVRMLTELWSGLYYCVYVRERESTLLIQHDDHILNRARRPAAAARARCAMPTVETPRGPPHASGGSTGTLPKADSFTTSL